MATVIRGEDGNLTSLNWKYLLLLLISGRENTMLNVNL